MPSGATRIPLFWIAVSAAVGIIAVLFFTAPLWIFPGAWLILTGWALWGKRGRTAALLGSVAAAFYFYASARLLSFAPGDLVWRLAEMPQSAVLRGLVAGEPEASAEGEKRRSEFEFEVSAIYVEGSWKPAAGRVAATLKGQGGTPVEVRYGDILEATGFLARPRLPRNPGEFDARDYREGHGIYLEWFPLEETVSVLATGRGNWLVAMASALRGRMMRTLQKGLENDPEISGLMAAMLFGYRDGVGHEMKESFRSTGTMHLFAVSGQNVAVVTGLLLVFLQMAGVIRWRWAWLLFPVIFIFCLATGMQPSAQRAFLMALIIMVGWALYRPVEPLNLLGAAALLLWIWDPGQMFDLGFQLSFLVVGGLTLGSGPLTRVFHSWGKPDPWIPPRLIPPWRREADRMYFAFCALVAASLTAWLFSGALILYHFHLVSPISLLANILIVPLASLVVVVSALSVMGGVVWGGLAVILNQVNWLLLKGIIWLVTLLASVPGGHFYLSWFDGRDPEICQFTFLDGDRAFPTVIQFRGKNWILDTGSEQVWRYSGDPFRRQAGINFMEGAVLTQASRSHLGGAAVLLESGLAGWWGESGIRGRAADAAALREALGKEGRGRRFWASGDRLRLEEGLEMEVLWPDRFLDFPRAEDQGLVLRIRAGANRILWAGDISEKVEAILLERGAVLDADLLIQGEHSQQKNLSRDWLAAVGPKDLIRPRQGYDVDRSLTPQFWAVAGELRMRVWLMDQTGAMIFRATGGQAAPTPFLEAKPLP